MGNLGIPNAAGAARPTGVLSVQLVYIPARLGWILLTVLTVALFATGVSYNFSGLTATADERSLFDMGLSLESYAWYLIILNLLVILAHIVIGAVVFFRCSNRQIGLLIATALVCNGALLPLAALRDIGGAPALWTALANGIIFLGLFTSLTMLYVFPDGRFVPGWTTLLAGSWAVLAFLAVYFPDSKASFTGWPFLFQVAGFLIWSGIGVFAQIFRYLNVSGPVQRQQTKWALLGLAAAVLGPVILFISFGSADGASLAPNILYQRVGASIFTVSFVFRTLATTVFRIAILLFPISFAIAILRYRLWDIDVLINRTLVYGSLTGLLALMYFLSVLILGRVFRFVTGERQFAIVISTLAIAALFNPLRNRIQTGIDRRFYRRKYDAERALEEFSAALRDEVQIESLSQLLLDLIHETMQPEQVSIWLKDSEDEH